MKLPRVLRRFFLRPWAAPACVAVLALALTLPNLWGPQDRLYPLQGDSVEYQEAAQGVGRFLEELPDAAGKMLRGRFGEAERRRYGFDGWILQHATSYVASLGALYSSTGGVPASGRALTAFFFAAAAALLFLLTRGSFGVPSAVIATALFLFWPAHIYYGTAIMTEVPMIFFALAAAAALEWTRESRSPAAIVLGGVFLAIVALAKVTLRLVIVPALLLDLLPRLRQAGSVRHLLLRIAGVVVVLGLWGGFLRLAGMPGDPRTADGETDLWIYRGNYVPDQGFETVGLGDVATPEILRALRATEDLPLSEQRKEGYRLAWRKTISEYPKRWVALVFSKLGWFWTYPAVKEDVGTWFGSLPPPIRLQPILVLLGALGVSLVLLRGWGGLLPALFALYLSAVHASTHLVSRYDIPAVALILPYSAYAGYRLVAGIARAFRERTGGLLSGGGTAVFGAAIPALLASGVAVATGRDVWRSLLGIEPGAAQSLQTWVTAAALGLWMLPVVRLHRLSGHRWGRSILAAAIFPGLLCLVQTAQRYGDRDPDQFKARLEREGDCVVQTIALPPDLRWASVKDAEICLDLLPSVQPGYTVAVRVNGREVRRFTGRLESRPEDFLLDPVVHAVQDRYARVERALKSHEEGFLRARYPETGYEYYRQWYRVPVPIDLVRGQDSVRVELEFLSARGTGWVDCYGDEIIQRTREGRREIEAPAFLENPYELSSYRFALFASDREKADARLIRPMRLWSPAASSSFLRDGRRLPDLSPARGRQTGEYRIRLRLGLEGRLVYRPDPDEPGESEEVWAVHPRPDDRPLNPDDIRVLSARRNRFFGGHRTY